MVRICAARGEHSVGTIIGDAVNGTGFNPGALQIRHDGRMALCCSLENTWQFGKLSRALFSIQDVLDEVIEDDV